jgi:REP element-mobilizing transposase RayT
MYWQRRLPHWTPDDCIAFVTWRLAGTLPFHVLTAEPDEGTKFQREDFELDKSTQGPCWLEIPEIATIFVEALKYSESVGKYELYAWVVMPNHVHIVLKPKEPLCRIVRWLKAATANRANTLMVRTGQAFWSREYYDRWIRDSKELGRVINYVESNPVKAGIAASPEDWRCSSASRAPVTRSPAVPAGVYRER